MNLNFREEQAFLNRLTEIVEANLKNEQFGVSELAREFGKSRSYIHRRLKSISNESVSQFIRRIRLEKALELLRENDVTVAEIAYEVGFSSPAYFSRCFHEHYGYPPGEVKKIFIDEEKEECVVDDEDNVESKQLSNAIKTLSNSDKTRVRKKILLISVFILAAVTLTWIFYPEKELSIIVLPFENYIDDANKQFFVDGIREDIISNLHWITSLKVISRTSADRYRDRKLSIPEIAKDNNVNYALEGSVRQDEDKTRISVQLIDARHDKHLWSENFDRETNNTIGIQDDIALQVASNVKATITESEIRNIEKIPTQSSKAYEYYLQARFLLHKANSPQRSDFNKAGAMSCIQYYEKAIAEDENFAEAYAGLSNAWFKLSAWGFLGSNEGFLKARELSLKAIEIDPECAEAHSVLGAFLVWGQRNFEKGGKEYETSIRLNPNFATSRQGYAQYLMITGPIEEARVQVNRALELEPYFWVVQNLNSWIYYFEEKYEEALEACQLANDYNPNFSSNLWLLVLNYARLGEGEKMKQQLQSIAKRYSKSDAYSDGIQQSFDKNNIEGLFEWLIDINKNNPINVEGMNGHPFFIAWWNAILGNEEQAVLWLEKNMQQQNKVFHYFNLIATNPDFDILRDDPRFLKIVDDIGLTPYHKRKAK